MKNFLAIVLAAFSVSAQGTVITSAADPLLAGASIITFDELPLGSTDPVIAGVSFTGAGAQTEIVTTLGIPSTPDLNNNRVNVDIDFASAVGAFGLDILLADQDVTLEAFDALGTLLDTAVLVSPPGTIANGFRGIGGVGPIASARVTVAPEFIRLDNLHFVSAQIPEPATLGLLGLGLAGAFAVGLRRKPSV